jgi:NAD(P)-dependent dehydrogenase (short-subunit alcohol dehydrogenase family)
MSVAERTALVTGAAAGIGLATSDALARLGLRVIVTARTRERAVAAASGIIDRGAPPGRVHAEALDVADPAGARICGRRLAEAGLAVDVLVNNAALLPDKSRREQGVLDSPVSDWRGILEANFFGALWACREFVPGMLERGYGRVVNVSSDFGSIGLGLEGPAPYSVSKAALNALTIKLAQEVRARPDVKVNALNPGWVRSRMGGPNARRSLEEGADTVVWLATLPPDGPSGGFFQDRAPIPW